ncbi:MAG: hypothetical protein U0798_20870 [Gemmataceae bacterium]
MLLVSLICVYLLASTGFPIPSHRASASKDLSRPFPCMNNPCGCQTYEECWAGDCCCSTLAEKLAWARENHIIPPESATRLALLSCDQNDPECQNCAAKSSNKTCCEKTEHKADNQRFKMVIGLFAQKCKGQTAAGLGLLPVSVQPPQPFAIVLETLSSGRISLLNHLPTARVVPPDAPPPRV